MSKILRRPMFRGGKVDSRGTGITSGLMDTPKYATGGRVGYQSGDIVLGGDLYKPQDYSDFINQYFPEGRKTEGFAPALLNQMFDSEGNLKEDYTYESIFSEAQGSNKDNFNKDGKFTGKSVYDVDLLSYANEGLIPGDKSKRITSKRPLANLLKEDVTQTLKASEAYDTSSVPRGPAELGMTTRTPDEPPPPNTNNNNQEETTEIDPKTLMRENAELFKELLGEGNEKKLRDARIQDASDYLLKFFEGSQREGATVGSSGAEVAAFATSRPSKTERVKEGIEKGDQTAIALAINDYIAGKRSKEQIDLMEKKLGANFAQQIALIDYKNKKNNFFDNLKENRKGGMGSAEAIITTVQETFGKVPTVLTTEQVNKGVNVISKDNVGEYFVYPDGKVTRVIEDLDGKIIEDIVYSRGG